MTRPADQEKARTWRQRLKRYEQSGLTIADFCSVEQVSEHVFQYWRRRLANDGSPVENDGTRKVSSRLPIGDFDGSTGGRR